MDLSDIVSSWDLDNLRLYLGKLNSNYSLINTAPANVLNSFSLRVSGLLKHKSPEMRIYGCQFVSLLVKNSPTILHSHGSEWASFLMELLDTCAPDSGVQRSAIITLSHIFETTFGKQEMTREITTPRLPVFLKAVLTLAQTSSTVNNQILCVRVINNVLGRQPTSVRPISKAYTELLQSKFAAFTKSEDRKAPSCILKGLVLLHMAAQRGEAPEQWRLHFMSVIYAIHRIVSGLASGIAEEDRDFTNEVKVSYLAQFDQYAHLDGLFLLLNAYITTPLNTQVKFPLGMLADLSDRVYNLSSGMAVFNRSTSLHDRAVFLDHMESVQISVSKMLLRTIKIVGTLYLPHADVLLHNIVAVSSTSANYTLIQLLLKLATRLLSLVSTMPNTYSHDIKKLVRTAIQLTIPLDPTASDLALADYMSNPTAFSRENTSTKVTSDVVGRFLNAVVMTSSHLPATLRAEIDRYLLMHGDPTIAAVYPSKHSILPMAVNQRPQNALLLSIVHARLPALNYSATREPVKLDFNEKVTVREEKLIPENPIDVRPEVAQSTTVESLMDVEAAPEETILTTETLAKYSRHSTDKFEMQEEQAIIKDTLPVSRELPVSQAAEYEDIPSDEEIPIVVGMDDSEMEDD